MKIFFLYILFLSLTNLKAQIPLPEFNDKPAYFDQNKKQLVELEKSQYNTMAKAKGLFSAEAGFFLEGATSKVLIPRQTELKFIVKVVWPFESGNDQADTYWGNRSAEFQKNNPQEKGLRVTFELTATQNN